MQDVADHPDVNLPDPGHGPAMQHSTQMAGDVIPMKGELSMGSGPDKRAIDYAAGQKSDPKVIPMPATTTINWGRRQGYVK